MKKTFKKTLAGIMVMCSLVACMAGGISVSAANGVPINYGSHTDSTNAYATFKYGGSAANANGYYAELVMKAAGNRRGASSVRCFSITNAEICYDVQERILSKTNGGSNDSLTASCTRSSTNGAVNNTASCEFRGYLHGDTSGYSGIIASYSY